jgi:hypothetical protein
VVRTEWALSKFGSDTARAFLKPAFFWSGGKGAHTQEAKFLKLWDPQRNEKESSAAEGYAPSYPPSKYSMIMVDKKTARDIEKNPAIASKEFVTYLKSAKKMLPCKGKEGQDVNLAYCSFSQCGADIPTKIISIMNNGLEFTSLAVSLIITPIIYSRYLSRNTPRQRFFIDYSGVAVTNQCIYMTVNPRIDVDIHFFLGLLNSSMIALFLIDRGAYDDRGRLRLFKQVISRIPYKSPSKEVEITVSHLSQLSIRIRQLLYCIHHFLRGVPDVCTEARSGRASLKKKEEALLRKCRNPIIINVTQELLEESAKLQHGVDQCCYILYNISAELQLKIEKEFHFFIEDAIVGRFPRSRDGLFPAWLDSMKRDTNAKIMGWKESLSSVWSSCEIDGPSCSHLSLLSKVQSVNLS